MYRRTRLDNGLKIVACPMPRMRSAALGIWINAGGRYESSQDKGISHYLEHLLFKGTKKYSCLRIKESIEGIGGSLNGFTSEELTCYLVKVPSRHLRAVTDILCDMVINPALPEPEVLKEKAVILEEIKMYKDLPHNYVYELLDELMWPGQPLGAPIIGTSDSIAKINRRGLSAFKEEFYTPSNIVVSAAGLLDYDRLLKDISGAFSRLKEKSINIFDRAIEEQDKPQIKLLHKDTEQTHMALGFHGLQRDHEARQALSLLHIILGANMSSRLFNEIREKRGLAYEIGTHVKKFHDTGLFLVHAGIDNLRVVEAVGLILKEIERIKYRLVKQDELKRAKEFYLGQMSLALEDTLDNMLWVGETTATLDRVYSLEEVIKEVNRVSLEDIRAVARGIFKNANLNLALIGPLKASHDKIYNQLKLN